MGRVSRNFNDEDYMSSAEVAPRMGRVSRNDDQQHLSVKMPVAPRMGRVSRNGIDMIKLGLQDVSRLARGV